MIKYDPFIDQVNKIKHELKLQSRKSFKDHKVECPLCKKIRPGMITIESVRKHIQSVTHIEQLAKYHKNNENI